MKDVRPLNLAQHKGYLQRFGWDAVSFQSVSPGMVLSEEPEGKGAIAFRERGRSWVLAGSPLCPADELAPVLARVASAARKHQRRAIFFGVEERTLQALLHAPSAIRRQFTWVKIGEQPVLSSEQWSLQGSAFRDLRSQLRRAARAEVQVQEVPFTALEPEQPLRLRADALLEAWKLSRRMSLMGFLVGVHPFECLSQRRFFIAEQQGKLVGLLSAVPIYERQGWFFEELIRHPSAPNGTAELLVDLAMRCLSHESPTFATLGLAPLSGSFCCGRNVPWWLPALFRLCYDHAGFLYSFEGIRHFREKFRPIRWEPVYLIVSPASLRLPALFDILSAFVPGSRLRFAFETVRRLYGHLRRRVWRQK